MASLRIYSLGAMLVIAGLSLPAEARKCYQCVGLGGKVKGNSPCIGNYMDTGVGECPVTHDYCYIVQTSSGLSTIAVDRGCANETKASYCNSQGGQSVCYSWCNSDSCNSAAGITPGFLAILLPTIACMVLTLTGL
ncbi:U-scoloptoxin(05)-Sa1a-like [Branchiostoma floridae]|uniref:U-scoloptoxin(05)-Sa1a-like n=1 Tax=Branchiostoma floridae TaxID=7739 RepID=A0A9J7MJ54_BRAFL|nr:U-scoloptoxin(05)-Sa1a-like [Branchiostoma floridae]